MKSKANLNFAELTDFTIEFIRIIEGIKKLWAECFIRILLELRRTKFPYINEFDFGC